MKKLTITFLTCLIFLSPNVVMSETTVDLVWRNGLWYEKFTEVPFTGRLTGKNQGLIKNGKTEGAWIQYHDNGQLLSKGTFKKNKKVGAWIFYRNNGHLWEKGNYENGKKLGPWQEYHRENGQLWKKGNYENGKKEGPWVFFMKDGTVDKRNTGTYKDGKKVSD